MASVTESTKINGVFHVVPAVHRDNRGLFVETFRREWIPSGREMIQANRADRQAGCIVGLHYHLHQADYWYVPFGLARIVLHDLRDGSPTDMTITYLVDGYYNAADELGVMWNDPAVTADWGVADPILSKRDQTNPG